MQRNSSPSAPVLPSFESVAHTLMSCSLARENTDGGSFCLGCSTLLYRDVGFIRGRRRSRAKYCGDVRHMLSRSNPPRPFGLFSKWYSLLFTSQMNELFLLLCFLSCVCVSFSSSSSRRRRRGRRRPVSQVHVLQLVL
ncbi:hypothetical protein F2P81_007368 [Scophthalmus maximus]|uniref:Uncharacterized protein n=1 Tax=Scophthalmus maximus TaxID=52904 RepID=A0A6A4TCC6_SCOMX|nr:hypothetical protein F2P81_007368 [Scophthalmus maximus]